MKMVTMPDGQRVSLSKLARDNDISYNVMADRYRHGIRDPMNLVYGSTGKRPYKIKPRKIQKREIDWLVETRWARQGQPDEWNIACDLIGVSRSRAKEIQRLVEGAMK